MDVAHRNSNLGMCLGHLVLNTPRVVLFWEWDLDTVECFCSLAASIAELRFDCFETHDQAETYAKQVATERSEQAVNAGMFSYWSYLQTYQSIITMYPTLYSLSLA